MLLGVGRAVVNNFGSNKSSLMSVKFHGASGTGHLVEGNMATLSSCDVL